MNNHLTITALQHALDSQDATVSLQHIVQRIRHAAAAGAALVVLQELHNSPYFCLSQQACHFDQAEPVPGHSTQTLSALAAELNIVIVASLFERRMAGVYHNTAVVLDTDRGLVGQYRKMHIPDDPGYHEKYYFTPGDIDPGFKPIQTSLGKLGVLVCWDQWYPEAARLMALAGAELLIYPTAIGWDLDDNQAEQQRQLDAWQTIQRAHAIANGLPLVACNRIGLEQDAFTSQRQQFWGHSFICGPQGEILAQAGVDEAIVSAELDLRHSETVRRTWPFLRDRRVDAYADLTRRLID